MAWDPAAAQRQDPASTLHGSTQPTSDEISFNTTAAVGGGGNNNNYGRSASTFMESGLLGTQGSSFTELLHTSYDVLMQQSMQTAMELCKKQFSSPFGFLLMSVGWKAVFPSTWITWKRVVNVIVPLFLFSAVLFSYVFQIVACKIAIDHETSSNDTNISSSSLLLEKASAADDVVCINYVTLYIIPSCLHFIAYSIGFYHMRVAGNEEMYALIEKVFQSTSMTSQAKTQKSLVRRLWYYMLIGLSGVLVSIVTHLFHDINFYRNHHYDIRKYLILNIFSTFGYTISNLMTIVIILNYILTCDLIIFLVQAVTHKLSIRSMDISAARKEVLMVKNAIDNLNGPIGVIISLLILILVELLIVGSILFFKSSHNDSIGNAYQILFLFQILPTLFFPIIQAARVSSCCNKLKHSALSMRAFGYPDTTDNELDSFILFIMATHFHVRIFRIPMKASVLSAVFVAGGLCIILLSTMNLLPF